jgi:hypothetical protein
MLRDIDLTTLPSSDGIVIYGAVAGDKIGGSVNSAGDFNNDGVPDIIFSGNATDPFGRSNAGTSYILFGISSSQPSASSSNSPSPQVSLSFSSSSSTSTIASSSTTPSSSSGVPSISSSQTTNPLNLTSSPSFTTTSPTQQFQSSPSFPSLSSTIERPTHFSSIRITRSSTSKRPSNSKSRKSKPSPNPSKSRSKEEKLCDGSDSTQDCSQGNSCLPLLVCKAEHQNEGFNENQIQEYYFRITDPDQQTVAPLVNKKGVVVGSIVVSPKFDLKILQNINMLKEQPNISVTLLYYYLDQFKSMVVDQPFGLLTL